MTKPTSENIMTTAINELEAGTRRLVALSALCTDRVVEIVKAEGTTKLITQNKDQLFYPVSVDESTNAIISANSDTANAGKQADKKEQAA